MVSCVVENKYPPLPQVLSYSLEVSSNVSFPVETMMGDSQGTPLFGLLEPV